ncbi:MAG: Glu/Leu/Phe/Val dehydrogenase dimerization domain-containing protein [Bacillota bacterium]|nr:MAG: leucine dehydrogenase [Bacillota bacterium]
MGIFEQMAQYGHEQLVFCYDKSTGLRAIIAIHDTTLGPALGGLRMWPYEREEDAITDVLRLSRGMTYKNSAMGLNLGGGKAVLWGDPRTDKSEELFRAFGKFVESLGGRYITAEDVGTTVADMNYVMMETDHVCGREEVSGDPSPVTAYGVFMGIKACVKHVFGSEDLKGKKVAVQGLGKVGYHLCKHLHEAGAELIVTDIDPELVEKAKAEFGAKAVAPDEIYSVECDIFSPCALGAILNDETIPKLKCKIVAGAANNQLKEPRHGDMLRKRGILYAPDFVINGGGVINVAEEYHPQGYDRERALKRVATIYDKLLRVFKIAEERNISTAEAADVMAEERMRKIHQLNRIYLAE